ncbi:MAG: hypothetical protein U1E25_08715 [Methylocystis sp.]
MSRGIEAYAKTKGVEVSFVVVADFTDFPPANYGRAVAFETKYCNVDVLTYVWSPPAQRYARPKALIGKRRVGEEQFDLHFGTDAGVLGINMGYDVGAGDDKASVAKPRGSKDFACSGMADARRRLFHAGRTKRAYALLGE